MKTDACHHLPQYLYRTPYDVERCSLCEIEKARETARYLTNLVNLSHSLVMAAHEVVLRYRAKRRRTFRGDAIVDIEKFTEMMTALDLVRVAANSIRPSDDWMKSTRL